MPYTTNKEFIHYAKCYDEVLRKLKLAGSQYAERVSYAIVQPCMANKKEYRVVVLGGKAKYIANVDTGTAGKAFSRPPHGALFSFAEKAVQRLKRARPATLSECVIRVDIFQRSDGDLVVNEFESLEARIYGTSHAKEESSAQVWIGGFWLEQMRTCLKQYCHTKN